MGTLGQDLRYAFRSLRKSPVFTAVAVATLAVGIGANTAIFSVVRGILWRPLPYPAAERLLVGGMSVPDFEDFRAGTSSYEGAALYASNLYSVRFGDGSEQRRGAVVSRDFFGLLGRARLGRALGPGDAREPVAVLSHAFWTSRFAADPAVLGRPLALPDRSFQIVGVMPPEFQFPGPRFDFWVPLEHELARVPGQDRNRALRVFRAVALRKAGVSPEAAAAETAAISARLARAYPDTNADFRITLQPIAERLLGASRPALLVLLGAVGLVLLIASVNVANLLLARATARSRELGIRTALGASPARILRQLVTESLLLAACGAAAGMLLGAWAVSALPRAAPPELPRLSEVRLDLVVLAFTLGVAAAAGLIAGVLPSWLASRGDSSRILSAARGASAGRGVLRQGLVVAEVALAVVILVSAGLLTRSLYGLLHVEKGFVPERLLTFHLNVGDLGGDPERRALTLTETTRRLEALPGVEAAGGGSALPPETAQRSTRFEVEGRPELPPDESSAYFIAADPGYFRALGTRVLEGRAFSDADRAGAAPVAMINRSLANRLFPDATAVGRRVRLRNPDAGDAWRDVVGVVEDVRYQGLDDPGEAAVYTPFSQTPFLWSYVMVRTRVDPESVAAAVREAVRSVDPRLLAARVESMERIVGESVASERFQVRVLSGFAGLALLLALLGVYGVIAYATSLRRREIGIRVALGATPGDVRRLVAGGGLKLVLLGFLLGALAALGASRVLAGLLFGVGPADPLTYAGIGVIMALTGVAAAAGPARAAARTDPVEALRAD